MGSPATPPNLDDALSAFASARAALGQAASSIQHAQAAADAANAALGQATSDNNSAKAAFKSAGDAVVAAIQAAEAGL